MLVFVLGGSMAFAGVPTAPEAGEAVYAERCAACHADPGTTRAPSLETMRDMPAERVAFALTNGIMKSQAEGLSFRDIRTLVSYASAGDRPDYLPVVAALCANREVDASRPRITGWGMDPNGARRIGAEVTRIDAGNVSRLELKWAFGLPGASEARSQPVATEDTLFVAASSGHVFALDRHSGCIKWHRATPVRTSLLLGEIGTGAGVRGTLFFGDTQGFVTALDATDGRIVWRTRAGIFEASTLTGALVQHGERLFVPISSAEVGLAANPQHECCRTHGAIRALDAATGEVLWTHHMTPHAQPTTPSRIGVMRWAPSGAPVWSTPTVDARRGLLYVGTGQNYSSPPTDRSDAIVALDLETGEARWHFQATAGDAWNIGCGGAVPGPNCPDEDGPDFDFGAAVVIATDSRGRELLLAGQKSGGVWALDPDDGGKVVWNRRLGSGSKLGGIHWGLTADGNRLFVPLADPPVPNGDHPPEPGLYALAIDDGSLVWKHLVERGCETDMTAYSRRETLYPDCSFFYALSSAPTTLPGVVVTGALDGRIRAIATADGSELWRYDTMRPFDTVNGVPAHGGSIDSGGAIAVGTMLYIQSGYSAFRQLPGNVLLAFGLP
jgi:polyvinyl alcohol dehydrogenase (cytochrome)